MIVIVGETHDDILYFESVLANRKEETILNRYKISIGTIFSQEAIIVHELYTSILASAVLMYILNTYYVDLVISVGRCMSVSPEIKNALWDVCDKMMLQISHTRNQSLPLCLRTPLASMFVAKGLAHGCYRHRKHKEKSEF